MNKLVPWYLLLLPLLAGGKLAASEPSPPLPLRDGDRIVLVGDAFVERMQAYGWFEGLVTVAHAERQLEFRNLGWAGDTVQGIARAVFGSPDDGFARLEKDVRAAEPDILLVHYGGNEAYRGEAGVDEFRAGLNRLLDMLQSTGARTIVLLSPHRRLVPPAPLPDPAAYNAQLPAYCQVLREAAESRKLVYVDLLDLLEAQPQDRPPWQQLTDNGMHLSPAGYRWVAPRLARRLGLLSASSPAAEVSDELRQAIGWKNELYFHRYRPQNETYLFLFRKHEQGNNAAEIPQFDPLVTKAEARIHALAREAAGN